VVKIKKGLIVDRWAGLCKVYILSSIAHYNFGIQLLNPERYQDINKTLVTAYNQLPYTFKYRVPIVQLQADSYKHTTVGYKLVPTKEEIYAIERAVEGDDSLFDWDILDEA